MRLHSQHLQLPDNNNMNSILEDYIKAIVNETLLKEAHDAYGNPVRAKSGLRHYKIAVPKKKVKPVRPSPLEPSALEDHQREFLVNTLQKMSRNATAQKILTGMPLTKKEVYALAKTLVQSGTVPVRHFKELARILAGLAFELQGNSK